jgi:acyl-CoA thioesterase FadM
VDERPDVYADGAAVVVFVDTRSQKPVRIPDGVRKLLS